MPPDVPEKAAPIVEPPPSEPETIQPQPSPAATDAEATNNLATAQVEESPEFEESSAVLEIDPTIDRTQAVLELANGPVATLQNDDGTGTSGPLATAGDSDLSG